MTLREQWCLFAPWHNLELVRSYGGHAHVQHVRCTWCGCEFGMNHRVKAVLPWRDVCE